MLEWLTSFDARKIRELIQENSTFETFFQRASLNPNAHLIIGAICEVRVGEITDSLMQKIRF